MEVMMGRKFSRSSEITKAGLYKVKIISAFHHKSRKGRRCIVFTIKRVKKEQYATIYLALQTPKGKTRQREQNTFNEIIELCDIGIAEPVLGDAFYFNIKEKSIAKTEKYIYPDFENKELWVELGVDKSYERFDIFYNYRFLGIYHPETKQTAEEYRNNLTAKIAKEILK